MPEAFVGKTSEMQDGERRIVMVGDREVGVFCKGKKLYAYQNLCVHAGGPACEGLLINRVVDIIDEDRTYQGQSFSNETHFVCPWHGYEYDLETGACVGAPHLRLARYQVVNRGDSIYVIV